MPGKCIGIDGTKAPSSGSQKTGVVAERGIHSKRCGDNLDAFNARFAGENYTKKEWKFMKDLCDEQYRLKKFPMDLIFCQGPLSPCDILSDNYSLY